jgi:hypothetical protein
MKSLKNYLFEANILRFLRKNKNLTSKQAEEINKFFESIPQIASEFANEYDWQSEKVRNMTYDDFWDYIMSTIPGRKKYVKKIKVKGKEGKDYMNVIIKNKNYVAHIPLNQKTAQYMNSCDYGTIHVNYCIGWNSTKYHWNRYIYEELLLPIYIVNGIKKWVVMLDDNNNIHSVWDKFNNENVYTTNKEPIPDFSLKKELFTPQNKKIYEESRKFLRKGMVNNADLIELKEQFESVNNNVLYYDPTIKVDAILKAVNTLKEIDKKWIYDSYIEIQHTGLVVINNGRIKGFRNNNFIPNRLSFYKCSFNQMNVVKGSYITIDSCVSDGDLIITGANIVNSKLKGTILMSACMVYGGVLESDSLKSSMFNVNLQIQEIKGFKIDTCTIRSIQTHDKCHIQYCDIDNTTVKNSILDDCEFRNSFIYNSIIYYKRKSYDLDQLRTNKYDANTLTDSMDMIPYDDLVYYIQ